MSAFMDGFRSALGIFDPKELSAELDRLASDEREISADLQVLKSELDGYETEGYEYFKKTVLPKELDAIAHRLAKMDESPDARDARVELRGRYKQVQEQMSRYSVMSARASELRDRLRDNLEKQRQIQEEIKREQQRRAV